MYIPAKPKYQYACINSDIAMTIKVNAGSSAPKPSKISWNTGTTKINSIEVTMSAITKTEIGYVIAFLIFDFSASAFSW